MSLEMDIRETIRDIALKEIVSVAEMVKVKHKPFPYRKKSELKKELGINEAYYQKLVRAGMREVILQDGDKTIWVSKTQLTQLMDKLAE
ncbi:hypothetical protein ACI1TC_08480 [Lactococcus petauri]|uniref:hypothetical protein n=1 Tax=Lactococcus petauri TaxID=1940789 RepID=UPI003854897F